MVWRNNEFCYATKVDWPWWTSQTRALPEQRTAVHHTFCRCIRVVRRRHSSTTWFCAVCPRRTVGCTVPMATIPPRPDTPEWQTKMWATVSPTRMNGMPFSNSRYVFHETVLKRLTLTCRSEQGSAPNISTWVLQASDLWCNPSQDPAPPMQDRSCLLVPSPHVALQMLHVPHGDHVEHAWVGGVS